ncbi:hypothetical protein WPS_29590 [Vulcanimicrobium alpinum]|uniref:Uncharacterized protein n=1 Tax=Vulcanimicrobium alpinum TaxID=3016050 RepID=A0AAN1XYF9_UNVUL|nr:hypothetical protein [Vulcanimicrobium alpinum]BDE07683.1 hypothetical protein WPS_29590 [Vulcanimicrobium alpinum]
MFALLVPLLAALSLVAQAQPDPNSQTYHVGPTPPPHGYPVIHATNISSSVIHPGRPVTGNVTTSENVYYVEARIEYRSVALHKEGPGRFSLSYTLPWYLPPWLRHAYTLEIVARTVDGVEAWRGIPVTVR